MRGGASVNRALATKRRAGSVRARVEGYILLEVVMALSLLLLGLTYIGGQVQKSDESARETVDLTRWLLLADMKLAELDTGMVDLDLEADAEAEGDFTRRFPSYGWRMRFDATATEGLRMITLDILYSPRASLDDEFDFDNAVVVHTVHTFRAAPAAVDLQKDFGLDDEAIAKLEEETPFEGFDPTSFDPSVFARLDMETLLTVLPSLMQAFGISMDQVMGMVPPEFRDLLENQGSLEDLANEAEGADESGRGGSSQPSGDFGGRGSTSPQSLQSGGGRGDSTSQTGGQRDVRDRGGQNEGRRGSNRPATSGGRRP